MYKKYAGVLLLLLLMAAAGLFVLRKREEAAPEPAVVLQKEKNDVEAGVIAELRKALLRTGVISPDFKVAYLTPEEEASLVYTFLQGPRAYGEGLPWSGEWCEKIVSNNSFGGFGCGLCCMANIYSTLSPYECSPWSMFEFATTSSFYYPSSESGAIGWQDMQMTLRAAGLACELRRKPKSYRAFQKQMKKAKSAVVLVSSAYDDAFWKDTSGHYVNIWLYQEETDLVFLSEPGDPERNRTWIPLRYVYDALKTVSSYQYLAVTAYYEGANVWKKNGIDDIWNGKF